MNARVTSTAVMARRVEPADSLDFFPTPPWGTRAFWWHVLPHLVHPADHERRRTAYDPACGQGHMALALAETFEEVFAADIFDYGFGKVADFLHPDNSWAPADWIIFNPPFNQAAEFIDKGLKLCRVGVACLARTAFCEGQDRYKKLFLRRPPQVIGHFVERLPMHRGRWVVKGKSATAYSWFCWLKNPSHEQLRAGTKTVWIPPCRATLTGHEDWLKFSGCTDLPKKHQVVKLMEKMARDKVELATAPRKPATLADVRAGLAELMEGARPIDGARA